VSLSDEQLLKKVADHLIRYQYTIATAESCTGGLLAHMLTNVSGSSQYFERGVIAYSNKAKHELLHVPTNTIANHGAVSKETAEAMARGIQHSSGVTIGVSTTGIAGPTGGTKDKPVGLVYIGLAIDNTVYVEKHLFKEERLGNKERTCNAALQMLLRYLKK
jgi:PncC family amidohydrolase